MDEVDANNLAWECLRRSPLYQKDFLASVGSAKQPHEVARISSGWGLRFPCAAQPNRSPTKRLLDG
ncbi:DUF6499 domain-containing protein [Ochrobactrum sp. WV_118_8]|nr:MULTISPECIES: DUF6499 domain-containing protein [Hyphomicrobiales]MCZ7455965.1 DUF6499 domain-containing protein [Rhizobium rhizogenes]MDH0873127.1 DUF6499 domain-containing protein [Agrobacterium pusense]MDH2090861.1 DUF6499 domain-containing protein [Agrobacterium pusense]WLR99232.1 DUF6499 domain-containing protein [Shinella sumterensis]